MQRIDLTDPTGLSGWYFVDGNGQKYGPLPPMGTIDPETRKAKLNLQLADLTTASSNIPPFIADEPIDWDKSPDRFARLHDYVKGFDYAMAREKDNKGMAIMGNLNFMNNEEFGVICQYGLNFFLKTSQTNFF